MRVTVDSERCQGHGRCYMLSPDVFDCDEAGFSVVREENPSGDAERQARVAEQSCPEQAISVSDE